MNCYAIIFAVVVVSAQASTVGRVGWGQPPALPSINANVAGLFSTIGGGNAAANVAGAASAYGDAAQPASMVLQTEEGSVLVGGGESAVTIIADPITGDTYTDNQLIAENAAAGVDLTSAHVHGTSAQVTNAGGSDATGYGEIAGAAATNTQVINSRS